MLDEWGLTPKKGNILPLQSTLRPIHHPPNNSHANDVAGAGSWPLTFTSDKV